MRGLFLYPRSHGVGRNYAILCLGRLKALRLAIRNGATGSSSLRMIMALKN